MIPANVLEEKLAAIDGQDYAAYQSLLGSYDFELFKLIIQQIPKDDQGPCQIRGKRDRPHHGGRGDQT